MKAKRLLYLGYYLKQMDWDKLHTFNHHAAEKSGKWSWFLLADALQSVFRYNISVLEYFQFRFYELSAVERKAWAGTGYMYEYQRIMNPPEKRGVLDDKTKFFKQYSDFMVHTVADVPLLQTSPEIVERLLSNPAGKLVFKVAVGKCGKEVEIKSCEQFTASSVVPFMKQEGFDLVEEFVIQHPALQTLSPSAVNTVRIFTQLDDQGKVHLLGCRLRISVNSPVDNMAAGNLAAPIDEATGRVYDLAVYSDITKPGVHAHPITGVPIVGFQVPFWEETVDLVKQAALRYTENRSIGWDVVITEKGPGLIEGNHDWCKLLWQLPVKNGLKMVLEKYV